MKPDAELPCWKIKNLRRRVVRARKFPLNTCPSSRHLHTMADALSGPRKRYEMLLDEPEHCAQSIYAVLESLWKTREELVRLKNKGV